MTTKPEPEVGVNQQGGCLICLNRFDIRDDDDGRCPSDEGTGLGGGCPRNDDIYVRFLKFCRNYLRLCGTTEVFLKAVRQNDKEKFRAFCDDCQETVTQILDIYNELKNVELKLIGKLEGMEVTMVKKREGFGKERFRGIMRLLKEQLKVGMMTRVELLRSMVQLRCGRKGKEVVPRVEVPKGLFPEHWKVGYPACKIVMMRLIVIFALASTTVSSTPTEEPKKGKVSPGKARRGKGRLKKKEVVSTKENVEAVGGDGQENLVNVTKEISEVKIENNEVPEPENTEDVTLEKLKGEQVDDDVDGFNIDIASNYSGGAASPDMISAESDVDLQPEEQTPNPENNPEEPPTKRWNLRKRNRKPVVNFAESEDSDEENDKDKDYEEDQDEVASLEDEEPEDVNATAAAAIEANDLEAPPNTKSKSGRGWPRLGDCQPQIPCPKCKKLLLDKRSLASHLIRVHDTRLTYSCILCGQKFIRWKDLRNHKREKHRQKPDLPRWSREAKARKCPDCLKVFVTLATLAAHRRECPMRNRGQKPRSVGRPSHPKQCSDCNLVLDNSHLLIMHRRKEHPTSRKVGAGRPPKGETKCPFCPEIFPTGQLMLIHRREEHDIGLPKSDKSKPCPKCAEVFPTLKQMTLHYRQVHAIKRKPMQTTKCTKCDLVFRSESKMLAHRKAAHKRDKLSGRPSHGETKCPLCDLVLPSGKDMLEHTKEQHPETKTTRKCAKCGEWFANKSTWLRHQKSEHNLDWVKHECKICFKTVAGNERLKVHMEAHENGTARDVQLYYCEVCAKHFYKPEGVENHMEKAHGNHFTCFICKVHLETGKLLRDHLAGHEKPEKFFYCMVCFRGFSSQQYYDIHRTIAHKDQRRYHCDYDMCNEIFEDKNELIDHLRQHAEEAKLRGDLEWSEVYICSVCDKGFIKQYNFTMHKLTHTPHNVDRPGYDCPVGTCHRTVRYLETLISHYNRIHGLGLLPCKCYICGKAFGTQTTYKEHMRICGESQTDQQRFCNVCGLKFDTKEQLNQHKLEEHKLSLKGRNKTELLRCPEPGCAELRTEGKMNYHLVRAHGKGEKYPCEMCGMMFIDMCRVKEHMVVHFPPKHQCDICGKGFRKPHHMRVHRRTHNANREKAYICPICGKSYFTRNGLRFHNWSEHSDQSELPWKCEYCGKGYGRKPLFRMHVKTCAKLNGGVKLEDQGNKPKRKPTRKEDQEEDEMSDKSTTEDEEEMNEEKAEVPSTSHNAPILQNPESELRMPSISFSQWMNTTAASASSKLEAYQLPQHYPPMQIDNMPILQPEQYQSPMDGQ